MPEARARLPFSTQEVLRYSDQDTQGHINNSVYSTLYECNRVAFQSVRKGLVLNPGQVVVVAALSLEFLRELHWPGTVDIRLGVSRIGTSSYDFEQELWLGADHISSARSTQVVIDRTTRKPTPLTQDQRTQLEHWQPASLIQ